LATKTRIRQFDNWILTPTWTRLNGSSQKSWDYDQS